RPPATSACAICCTGCSGLKTRADAAEYKREAAHRVALIRSSPKFYDTFIRHPARSRLRPDDQRRFLPKAPRRRGGPGRRQAAPAALGKGAFGEPFLCDRDAGRRRRLDL